MPTQPEVEGAQEHVRQATENSVARHAQERIAVAREQGEKLEVKDVIFHELILARLADNFIEAFRDADYSYEDIQKISLALDAYPNREELGQLLAIPKDLLARQVDYFKKNNFSPDQIVAEMQEMLNDFHEEGNAPLLAYNTRKRPVKPVFDSRTGEMNWVILPTEQTDLAEHKLAYASRNYRSLYREKMMQKLYLVRDWEKNGYDASTDWSHAPTYSIIAELDLPEVDAQVNQIAEEIEKGRNAA